METADFNTDTGNVVLHGLMRILELIENEKELVTGDFEKIGLCYFVPVVFNYGSPEYQALMDYIYTKKPLFEPSSPQRKYSLWGWKPGLVEPRVEWLLEEIKDLKRYIDEK